VVLLQLGRLRASRSYTGYLAAEGVAGLRRHFRYAFRLGDQDWWTNLSFLHPALFHPLPCWFNVQTSLQYLAQPWRARFPDFHHCCPATAVRVLHRCLAPGLDTCPGTGAGPRAGSAGPTRPPGAGDSPTCQMPSSPIPNGRTNKKLS
jgi:hypothetical protein